MRYIHIVALTQIWLAIHHIDLSDIKNSNIFLDFNQHYEAVQFQCAMKLDQYRPGVPYRLLHYPLKSYVEILFKISDFSFLSELHLVLNCGSMMYQGRIDILFNDNPVVMDYSGLACDMAFHEHLFSLPRQLCVGGDNRIKIQLSDKSPGVCWLSDAKICGVYHQCNLLL